MPTSNHQKKTAPDFTNQVQLRTVGCYGLVTTRNCTYIKSA